MRAWTLTLNTQYEKIYVSEGKLESPTLAMTRPTIGTPTEDVHWSEAMNTLLQTAFITNPVIGDQVKCLHSRLEHLIVQSYIVVNSMYAYDTELRVSGIKVT